MASDEDDNPILGHKSMSFDSMSIADLEEYIQALTQEIEKTKQVIARKQEAQNAASGFFKN